jgi:hypothetical protein
MSVVKNEMIEHEIEMEEFEEGLKWLSMWGKKSFKDHTGEWVEVCCSTQSNFFDDTVEAIPHLLERS